MYTIIKSDEQHEAYLERLDELWGAEEGSEASDELELLAHLIDKYERERYPLGPLVPHEMLAFIMEQRGLTARDMEAYLGSPAAVSEVLAGKRPLSKRMIQSLVHGLGVSANLLVEPPEPETVAEPDWRRFKPTGLVQRGWVAGVASPLRQAREVVMDLCRQAGLDEPPLAACYRQGCRFSKEPDPYALSAWEMRVRALARRMDLAPYGGLTREHMREAARLSPHEDGPVRAVERLQALGVRVVIVPHLDKTYLDGGVLQPEEGGPVIGLTLRHDRLDNFWFTLVHEMAHIVLGHVSDRPIFDDLSVRTTEGDELEADALAGDTLIPPDLWAPHASVRGWRRARAVELAMEAGVHPAVVVGRARWELDNYRILHELNPNGVVRPLFRAAYHA